MSCSESVGDPVVQSTDGSVLIVKDEAAIRIVLVRSLRDHDVTVVACRDAFTELASGTQFDIILSDLMLPQITGWSSATGPTNRETVRSAYKAARMGWCRRGAALRVLGKIRKRR